MNNSPSIPQANIRVLIVDDETPARNRIKQFLSLENDFDLVGECDNGMDAVEVIRTCHPDLVFLDIQLPSLNGMEVAHRLSQDRHCAIVFVTAYEQHAVAAFEERALDYLLKPFTNTRFRETLNRARENLRTGRSHERSGRSTGDESSPTRGQLKRIAVKSEDRTLFVQVEAIQYFESAANYVVVHTAKDNHIVRKTLTDLESELPANFQRISRSIIANLNEVRELQPSIGGEYYLVLKDNRRLTMTRNVREVRQCLQYY
jgi:two-component system LytT family response regulator